MILKILYENVGSTCSHTEWGCSSKVWFSVFATQNSGNSAVCRWWHQSCGSFYQNSSWGSVISWNATNKQVTLHQKYMYHTSSRFIGEKERWVRTSLMNSKPQVSPRVIAVPVPHLSSHLMCSTFICHPSLMLLDATKHGDRQVSSIFSLGLYILQYRFYRVDFSELFK